MLVALDVRHGLFSPAGETVIDLAIGFNADVERKQSARRRDTALPRAWLVEKGEQAVGRGGVSGGGKVAQDHADALTLDYFLHVADAVSYTHLDVYKRQPQEFDIE